MGRYVTERKVWTEDGRSFVVIEHGKRVENDHEIRVPAVHLGNFPGGKQRRISGLARYPGDPEAVCSSMQEVERKAAAQGKRVARIEDHYYDTHDAYKED